MPAILKTPDVIPTQAPAVRLDAGALTAPDQALQAAGGTVDQIGQQLVQQSLQIQDHVNQGYLAQQDVARQQTWANIQQYMEKNRGTPESWDDYAKDQWQTYKDQTTNTAERQGWGPDVQRQNALAETAFVGRANIGFDAAKTQAQIESSNTAMQTQATLLAKQGKMDAAAAVIDGMDLFPGAKDALKMGIVRTATMENITSEMSGNAHAVQEKVMAKNADGSWANYGNMDAETRRLISVQAARIAPQQQRDQQYSWYQQMQLAGSDPSAYPDPAAMAAIRQRADDLGINPKVVDSIFTLKKPNDTPEAFAQFTNEVATLDHTKLAQQDPDEISKQYRLLHEADGFGGSVGDEAKAMIKGKLNEKDITNTPMAKDGNQLIGEKYNLMEKQATKAVYQPAKDDGTPARWASVTDKAAVDAAQAKRAQVQTAFNSFLAQNPNADPVAVQKFIHAAYGPQGGAAVFGTVNAATGTASPVGMPRPSTLDDVKAYPPGTPFIWTDGKTYRTRSK